MKNILLDIITNDPFLRKELSFKEHLELYKQTLNLSDEKISRILEEVEPPKTNPKVQQILTIGLAVASLAIPLPGLTVAIIYATDMNMYKCRIRCEEDVESKNKSLCYRRCKYLATKWAVGWIENELNKCSKVKKPLKCKKKLFKLLNKSKQKFVKEKILFKQKERELRYKRLI